MPACSNALLEGAIFLHDRPEVQGRRVLRCIRSVLFVQSDVVRSEFVLRSRSVSKHHRRERERELTIEQRLVQYNAALTGYTLRARLAIDNLRMRVGPDEIEFCSSKICR